MNNRLILDFGEKTFAIVDGHAIIHRAFHALPPLTNHRQQSIGALYGFLRVIFKIIKDYDPSHIVVAFDSPGPTFRHEIFPDYKATRVKAPDALYQQIPYIKKGLESLQIIMLEARGFEADDLIGTLSSIEGEPNKLIITGDADLLQLADNQTKIMLLQKGISQHLIFGPTEIKEKYGIFPSQIIELKGLRGDPSDNLPGVAGIGEKTGRGLLEKYDNLEEVYQHLSEISNAIKQKLEKGREDAFKSRQLATIQRNAPIDLTLEKYRWKGYNKKEAITFLEEFGLKSLINGLPEL